MDILVVGGGVVGTSIAWHLAKRGANVTLLEARSIAAVASGASAGGVRQQGRDPREMPLAIAAIARWESLEDELEADVQYYRNGHLQIYENEVELSAGIDSIAQQQQLGLEIELVSGAALFDLCPGITPHAIAGRYTANDGHANAELTTKAFAHAASRHGATIREGVRVLSLITANGRVTGVATSAGRVLADHVAVATGAWTRDLVIPMGIDLPLETHGLQMILTRPMPPLLKQVVGASGRPLSLKQLREGNYLIGGGWPGDVDMLSGYGTVREESIRGSFETAADVFPALLDSSIECSWVGVEAFSVDGIPIIGSLPGCEGITVAAGFTGHGFALSPISGQLVSELILDGLPSIPLDAFASDRFNSDDLSRVIIPPAG